LFAERGFDAVTVGDIEEAVGLAPRRGAMYRHFKSKSALLEAAVEAHLSSVASARDELGRTSEAGAGAARDLGSWILQEMDRQHDITRVLERDGSRMPALRERFRTEVSDAGYAGMAEILTRWVLGPGPRASTDDRLARQEARGMAVLLLGSLVNVRRSTWTLGAAPLAVDEDALLDAWATLCAAAVRSGTP
jgi:AcrR family transcriptional regulator